jgi:two-component system, cell cycle response regulator
VAEVVNEQILGWGDLAPSGTQCTQLRLPDDEPRVVHVERQLGTSRKVCDFGPQGAFSESRTHRVAIEPKTQKAPQYYRVGVVDRCSASSVYAMTDDILPPKVLFVDDDRSMRIAFANAARALGVESVVAESGGQALELAQQETFPVVVTDLRMPGIDGVALIERLSAHDPTAAFVLISADPELQGGLPTRADGAIAALLSKPLQVKELYETLARAFALHLKRRARVVTQDEPGSGSWNVLIVEDSAGDAALLEDYLSNLVGVTAVHVTRLRDALQAVHDQEFDVIVADLTLPDARGFDAVLRLQASAPTAAILAYSGMEDEALALQVVQLGAQDFLRKSSTTQESLLRALRFARERKRSELRLRRLAHYDQLTGLANRASFNDALNLAVARVSRQGTPLALMMIDLDGFKQVNDSAGHEAGDKVLQEVGVRLRCLFREYDVVARLGGDEFAVLLADVELPSLAEVGQRLLESLAEPIGDTEYRVTSSIGVAIFPDAGQSPNRLLRSADMAMYKAKRTGKNRIVFYDGPVPVTTNPTFAVQDFPSGSRLIAPPLPRDLFDVQPESKVLKAKERAS